MIDVRTYSEDKVLEICDGRGQRIAMTASEALAISLKLSLAAISLAHDIVDDALCEARTVREETERLAEERGTTVKAIKASARGD